MRLTAVWPVIRVLVGQGMTRTVFTPRTSTTTIHGSKDFAIGPGSHCNASTRAWDPGILGAWWSVDRVRATGAGRAGALWKATGRLDPGTWARNPGSWPSGFRGFVPEIRNLSLAH
jgi:hypothetical protein